MRRSVTALLVLVAAILAGTANASSIVSTSDVTHVSLGVNDKGQAMVTYTQAGKVVHVLASGAVNAIPPTRGKVQVNFAYDYSGGYETQQAAIKASSADLQALRQKMAAANAALDAAEAWSQKAAALKQQIAAGEQRIADLKQQIVAAPAAVAAGLRSLWASMQAFLQQLQAKLTQQTPAAMQQIVAANKDLLTTLGSVIVATNRKLIELRSAPRSYWKTFSCPRYTGPELAFAVAACTAPDGSFWAVQQWQRALPDYGAAPTAAQAANEIHLSHWTGPLPVLTVETDWSYHKWQHLFGTFTYDGHPVYGFRSTSGGKPLDTFGRNVYLDSFDADYGGGGWQRVNSWLTHETTGAWCYGISPHGAKNLTGAGSRYRLTVMGPGVTPDVSVVVPSPGAYNPTVDAEQNAKIAALHDNLCKPN